MSTILLENVSKYYKSDGRRRVAVENLNLTIEQGDFVFIVGSRGAGKSTLLKLISGEVKANTGLVSIDGQNTRKLWRWHRKKMRCLVGQVWQEPSLIRKKTIDENLRIFAKAGARKPFPIWSMEERIEKVLGLVGLSGINDRYPVELDSGEVRRMELARALINSPPILLIDEITKNLDSDNIWDIIHLLNDINRRGTTIVMATHDKQYVNIMHRRVVTLVDGHIFGDVKRGKYGDVG